MELTKFNDFLAEAKEITSIVKKKFGIDIPFAEIKEWIDSEGSFKNHAAVTKSFNAKYGVDISGFTKKEYEALEAAGILVKDGRTFVAGSGEAPKEDIEVGTASATKVSSLSKGKAKKLKIPQGKSEGKYQDFLDTVLMNMLGESQSKLLLTGDPGTGKSRTVENIMALLRMQVITVEAPHVSEEDIINIPYLVKRGNKDFSETSSFKETKTGFEVVQAESALITRLKTKKKITDGEYNGFLKKNKILQPLATEYKDVIDEIADKYATVLFLDEFYRSSSVRIQNLFRTILNGKLGTTPIPKNVYIIYASNMDNSDGCWHPDELMEVRFEDPIIKKFIQTKKHKEHYKEKLIEKKISVEPIEDYVNAKTKILHKCDCGGMWTIQPDCVLGGVKCGSCKKNNYIKDLNSLGIKVVPLEEYIDGETKILHKCTCGNVWKTLPRKVKQGVKCGCGRTQPFTKRHSGIKTILYYIKIDHLYKFGITKVKNKFNTIEENILIGRFRKDIKNGHNIEILNYKIFEDGEDAFKAESYLNHKYKRDKATITDFILSGNTELFENELQGVEDEFRD